jgi:phage tail-like protein
MKAGEPELNPTQPGRIEHAADFYRRYPGETVCFYTRAAIPADLRTFRVRIVLPPGLQLVDARTTGLLGSRLPLVTQDGEIQHLIWDAKHSGGQNEAMEICTETRVTPTTENLSCVSRAILSSGDELLSEESVTIAVQAKARYLKFLPNIYQDDELMGRFLMLFESFLDPVEQQIEGMANYLDPQVAPAELLAWLASWSGLAFDDQLPENRRRELLKEAAFLFKKRGTRQGLEKYLTITTGGNVSITEHFSENFCLGPTAFLGPGIALGMENLPNTFSVYLKVPPFPEGLSAEECEQRSLLIERKAMAILEREKPVHTGYELHLEIGSERGVPA